MIRTTKLAVVGLVVAALVGISTAAQAQMTVNADLAKRGKMLFQNRGCTGCHSVGKGRMAGPDLLGVTDRRDAAWLHRWLKETDVMLASDSIAQAMLAEAKGVKMPNLKLTDADIDALLNYIAQETEKRKGS
jgi:protein SCO1/2